MSTRSKTKALAAAAPVAAESSPSSNGVRTSSRIRRVPASKELAQPDDANQDNGKRKTRPKPQTLKGVTAKAVTAANSTASKSKKKAYCLCRGPDDGSPMVQCSECKDWYHLACVNLSEKDAKGIKQYVCPPCVEKASQIAIAETKAAEDVSMVKEDQPASPKEDPAREGPPEPREPVSESEPSSEDDYVAESEKTVKGKKSSAGKRTVRRLSLSSESSSDGELKQRSRAHRVSATSKGAAPTRKDSMSPRPSSTVKRKNPPMAPPPPQPKRKRAGSNATDDPTRKYCLGKLQEIFGQIFMKYPHVWHEDGENLVEKKPEDLTEEDQEQLNDGANKFAVELEQCVFEIYAEPDKTGQPSAGGKYKERFRMLDFNLSKPDRVVLHKRIASLAITPKEISIMSSTDLADEETKQHIKIAEKESLEHSILQKTKVPLAKITHKGLQEIEDLNGSVRIDREIEREQEEEQRRERERIARLRAASISSLPKPQGSVPPESPVVPHTPLWGGPPSLPLHAVHPPADSEPSPVFSRSPVTSVFPHTAPEFTAPEPELNLDEFINIDEDPSPQDSSVNPGEQSPVVLTPTTPTAAAPAASPPPPSESPSTTGISPFAANVPKTDMPSKTTFDLNALWTAPKAEASTHSASSANAADTNKPSFVDRDLLGPEADDQDFDMFLEKDQDDSGAGGTQTTPEAQQAAFNALPQVWSGMINMPLDSTIPQETRVVARQMGGRPIAYNSPLWRTLFPSEQLRIDGRVPIDKSSQFLLQMRMNPTKELIGVTFLPGSESSDAGFRILSDFLIAKGRHGLVFPWGNRPKEHHPGKELYIIPLLSSDPLPDYMELLDELRLPKIRKSNYLIGIWVLNKGKLAPPVPQIPPSMASLPSNSMPLPASLAPVPAPPRLPVPPSIPLSLGHIAPATLAAEVASLTPEQIKLMLQTLASATASTSAPPLALVGPPLPVPPQPSHLPPPPPPPPGIPAHPPQPWPAHHPPPPLPAFAIPFQVPPPPPPQQPPPPPPPPPMHGNHQPLYPPHAGYDRNDRDEFGRDYRLGSNYGSGGDRPHRGRGRSRGRRAHSPLRPVDSGWPRNRTRNDNNNVGEGSGGPGGPSSPSRTRWGDSWK